AVSTRVSSHANATSAKTPGTATSAGLPFFSQAQKAKQPAISQKAAAA
ncbi:hypothetical protein OY671_007477, partial [Metschnikowia pulcherrima]